MSQKAARLSQRALSALPKGEKFLRGMIAANLVMNVVGDLDAQADLVDSERELAKAAEAARRADHLHAALLALGKRAHLQLLQGRLFAAEQSCMEALRVAKEEGPHAPPAAAEANVRLGQVK